MAHDKDIERRIAGHVARIDGLSARRMFGGMGYLYQGNMAFGIYRDNLVVRLGDPDLARAEIDAGRALAFDITGKAMRGWVMVPKTRLTDPQHFAQWLERGLACARSLPPK